VNNTSDIDKPISTAQAAVNLAKADLVAGKIPASQLPSYVDDVLEFNNLAAFPATGETGKIYIAIDTNRDYRWSGSVYTQIVASPGTTDNVPEGVTNKYYTDERVATSPAVLAATPLFQTETVDYVRRVLLVGTIDIVTVNYIDKFVTECKRLGVWSLMQEIWIPCGSNISAAMVKLKYASGSPSSNTNNGYTEAEYTQPSGVDTGTVTNSAKYISSGFIPSSVGLGTRNLSFGVFRPTPESLQGSGIASLMGLTPATGATGIYTSETTVGILPTSYADFHGGIGMKSASYGTASQEMFFESHSAILLASGANVYALDSELNWNRMRYNAAYYYASGKNGGGYIGSYLTKAQSLAISKAFYNLRVSLGSLLQTGAVGLYIGDSNTSGYGLQPSTLRWPTVLSQQKGLREINTGMASRQLRQSSIQAVGEYLSYTDVVGLAVNFLYSALGTNDMHIADVTTNGDATIIADFKTKYIEFVTFWKTQGVKIMLISPLWISDSNDTKITAYVNAVKEVAVTTGVLFFDAYHPFLDTGSPASSFQGDGTHLNPAGTLLMLKYLTAREQGFLIRNPTLDFASIAAGASATLTVNVPSATTTDNFGVNIVPTTPIDGIIFTASVTSADTVTVRAFNSSAAAIDPASQKFTITVNQN